MRPAAMSRAGASRNNLFVRVEIRVIFSGLSENGVLPENETGGGDFLTSIGRNPLKTLDSEK
jgi:hypothetical protein